MQLAINSSPRTGQEGRKGGEMVEGGGGERKGISPGGGGRRIRKGGEKRERERERGEERPKMNDRARAE